MCKAAVGDNKLRNCDDGSGYTKALVNIEA